MERAEEKKGMMQELMKILKEEWLSMFREEIGSLKEEMKEEIKEWEQRIRQEKEELRKEKEELQERIEKLEWEKERSDREEKRKNIIIRGYNFQEKELKCDIENLLTAKLKVETKDRSAQRLNTRREGRGSKIILVKLEKWEDKRKIMEKKKELNRGIYIEDNLTWKEKEKSLQKRLES